LNGWSVIHQKELIECVPVFTDPPPCEFAGDCAAVSCFAGFGNAVDSKQCPLRGCPCQGAASKLVLYL